MKPTFALLVFLVVTPSFAQQITVFASGGKSMTSYHGQEDVQSVTFEWSRPQWKQTDAGIALGSVFLWQPRTWDGGLDHTGNERVRAGTASVVVRHYWESHPAIYAELSSGPMWSGKPVPAATSRFNFLSQGGVGATVRPHSRVPLMIGIRFGHISNAGLAHHNPGVNFTTAVAGLRFRR